MTDKWPSSGGMSSYGRVSRAVTPSDTVDLTIIPKAVVVTVSGTLAVIPEGNEDADVVEFGSVGVGFIPPFIVRRVMATNTTATVYTVDDN